MHESNPHVSEASSHPERTHDRIAHFACEDITDESEVEVFEGDNNNNNAEVQEDQPQTHAISPKNEFSNDTLVDSTKVVQAQAAAVASSIERKVGQEVKPHGAIPERTSSSWEDTSASSSVSANDDDDEDARMARQRLGSRPSSTFTTGEVDQPKRMITVIRVNDENDSGKGMSGDVKATNIGTPHHRRGFSFKPGDDAHPRGISCLPGDMTHPRGFRHLTVREQIEAGRVMHSNPFSDSSAGSSVAVEAPLKTSRRVSPAGSDHTSRSPDKNPLHLLGKSRDNSPSQKVGPTILPQRVSSNGSTITVRRLSAESVVDVSTINGTAEMGKSKDGEQSRASSGQRSDTSAIAAARALSGTRIQSKRNRSPLSQEGTGSGSQRRGRQTSSLKPDSQAVEGH